MGNTVDVILEGVKLIWNLMDLIVNIGVAAVILSCIAAEWVPEFRGLAYVKYNGKVIMGTEKSEETS